MKVVRRKRRAERVPMRLSGDVTRWLEWSGSELRVRGDDGDAWSVDAYAASAGVEFAEQDDAFLAGANEEA